MSATSDFYLAQAAENARAAAATQLENVRERCLRSETAWLAMADRLLRNEALKGLGRPHPGKLPDQT